MGEEGFEPPAPWSQTKIYAVEKILQYHTRLDHSPVGKWAFFINDLNQLLFYKRD